MSDNDLQLPDQDQRAAKRLALSYVAEAFAEAELDGPDPDSMGHAALSPAPRRAVAASRERPPAKRRALGYVAEAFAEAELDGLDPDSMVHAALFAAFRELVATYGEEAAAQYAECLPQRVR